MILDDKRIRIIVGHYGSGKTEIAVNYAWMLSDKEHKITLVDLDIVNPYFRSREKINLLKEKGIEVISSSFGQNITADLPSLSSSIYKPLQDKEQKVILDVGGDSVGARTLARYRKYFTEDECDVFFVVNANRPETTTLENTLSYIKDIESEAGFKATGLINNTHMLQNTTVEDIVKGNELVSALSDDLNIPVKYFCCIDAILVNLPEDIQGKRLPIKMFMREKWMMVE